MTPTKPKCSACSDTGWLDPICPFSDGSYVTSRPCVHCWAYTDLQDKERQMVLDKHVKKR